MIEENSCARMPQNRRKVPFSGKQKKLQFLAKRQSKSEWIFFLLEFVVTVLCVNIAMVLFSRLESHTEKLICVSYSLVLSHSIRLVKKLRMSVWMTYKHQFKTIPNALFGFNMWAWKDWNWILQTPEISSTNILFIGSSSKYIKQNT